MKKQAEKLPRTGSEMKKIIALAISSTLLCALAGPPTWHLAISHWLHAGIQSPPPTSSTETPLPTDQIATPEAPSPTPIETSTPPPIPTRTADRESIAGRVRLAATAILSPTPKPKIESTIAAKEIKKLADKITVMPILDNFYAMPAGEFSRDGRKHSACIYEPVNGTFGWWKSSWTTSITNLKGNDFSLYIGPEWSPLQVIQIKNGGIDNVRYVIRAEKEPDIGVVPDSVRIEGDNLFQFEYKTPSQHLDLSIKVVKPGTDGKELETIAQHAIDKPCP